ncbi:MAG: hypothetical protein U0324_27005 [Polyangiales bacterium]
MAADLLETDKLLAKLARLTEFVSTRRAVAASDAVTMLDAVVEEVDHRVRRDPTLRDRYAATAADHRRRPPARGSARQPPPPQKAAQGHHKKPA